MEKKSWVRGKCIGRGSFGTVHLAFNNSNGAAFAVKSADRSHQVAVQALQSEIRILRKLPLSSHVVKFLGDDVSCESSTLYRNLHLEYLPGGTVADLGADVDEKIVRLCTRCIVSALSFLHAQGIAHCDVKGRNVLVGPSQGSAKLADFGSAVELSGGPPSSPRGSPLWMAPEVIRGEFQGPESDVWSLGCTVIEMVTGKPGWEDKGVDTLSRISFSDELPEFPSRLSELGRDFLDKCLRREPSHRWSCDQLLQHPFVSWASPSTIINEQEQSPRCVLDWFDSDCEGEEDEEVETRSWSFRNNNQVSAKDRIGKLALKTGADWESEDWVVVRSYGACEQQEEKKEKKKYCYWKKGQVRNSAEWKKRQGQARYIRVGCG